ncbi:MAG: TauD/TfdA family dioxygenase [Candidatus Latescibacterota bacterium]
MSAVLKHHDFSMPNGPIEGPSAWYGPDMAAKGDWSRLFSDVELAELDTAMRSINAKGIGVIDITRENFPLPKLGSVFAGIRHELLHGCGFTLLRGIPVERYSLEESAMIYYGIGVHLGHPVPQNAKGHVLGHVKDLGYHPDNTKVRIYQTTVRQTFHTDGCDFVSLFCLKPAKSGGLSSIVSSVTIFNEMYKRRPELAATLFYPLAVDRRGEVPEGYKGYFDMPPFNWFEGRLSTYYVRRYIQSAERFDDVPSLSEETLEALNFFDELANDAELRLDMEFKPGDIQVLHNHQILHDRTAFEDWPEPERKRHLLRLWLSPEGARPLPEHFIPRYNSVVSGDPGRGGIHTPRQILNAPLEAV